jgi:hypothetical protein
VYVCALGKAATATSAKLKEKKLKTPKDEEKPFVNTTPEGEKKGEEWSL